MTTSFFGGALAGGDFFTSTTPPAGNFFTAQFLGGQFFDTPVPPVVVPVPAGGGGSEPLLRRVGRRRKKRIPYWWEARNQTELRKNAKEDLEVIVEKVVSADTLPLIAAREVFRIEAALLSYGIVDFPALDKAKAVVQEWVVDPAIVEFAELKELLELDIW